MTSLPSSKLSTVIINMEETIVNANQPTFPYLARLNLPYLKFFINDPIQHEATWTTMPSKIPSNIPKFEGNVGEDPSNSIMYFNL
jgi:hypothetical protein